MTTGRYRMRPETVDAVQFVPGAAQWPGWLAAALARCERHGPVAGSAWQEPDYPVPALFVNGRRGPSKAEPGDWIVRHADGVLDVMRDCRFRDLFEAMEA